MFDDFLIDPTKLIVRYSINGVEGKPARVDFDRLDEMMRRCNAKCGDASKIIGGPKLPVVEVAKPTKRRRVA